MSSEPNDPTRSGAPVPTGEGGRARLSLSEIEALCLKAARGAGMSWGLAEEAGFAARWLAKHGLPGPELMLARLDAAESRIPELVIDGRYWRPKSGRLCPITAGAALADRADLDAGPLGGKLTIGPLDCPALILPFAAQVAHRRRAPLDLYWDGARVVVTAEGGLAAAEGDRILAASCDALVVQPADAPRSFGRSATLAPVDLAQLRRLDALALQTTVPATEQSRRDAGARSSDND